MKINPLCEYISAQLHTCVVQLSRSLEILHLYTTDDTAIDKFYKDEELLRYIVSHSSKSCPQFSFINTQYCFIHFTDTASKSIYILGPLILLSSTESKHALHTQTISSLEEYCNIHPPTLSMYTVTTYLMLLYNTLQEDSLTTLDCIKENFSNENIALTAARTTMDNIFQNRENDSFHTTFSQEMRLLHVIETGDVDGLKRIWEEPDVKEIVPLNRPNSIRIGKDHALYNITACGRASIRGGLQAEYIFSLTDSYIQLIEDLKDVLLLQSIVEEFQYNLVSMVAEKKRDRAIGKEPESSLLNQCKSFVFQHLHSKLTVAQIAEELHVHPNYLSSYFKEKEGLPLYQYILEQKIALAKNLLVYSDYSYIEIANYLDFTSQSHLGDIFRKKTGCTLKAYRDKYKHVNF